MVLPKANVVFWKSASLWKLIHNCTQKLTRGSCSKLLRAVWDSNYTTTILHCCWVVVEAVYNLCYCCHSFGTQQFNNPHHTTAILHCCRVVVGVAYNLVYFFVTCSFYPFFWHTTVQQCSSHYCNTSLLLSCCGCCL